MGECRPSAFATTTSTGPSGHVSELAGQTDDPVIKDELLELASVCEEVANNIEDHLTGG